MAWTDPRGDLRLLLNDDPSGRLVKEKAVFPSRGGQADGTRTTFFTLEDRLLASGNQSVGTQGLFVYLGSPHSQQMTEVSASGITVTDAVRGEFAVMGTAPSGVVLKASYYFRDHLDADLDFALQQGAQQVSADVVANVAAGLQLACLDFAGAIAHRKAAARWQARKSEQFLLEDAPAKSEVDARVAFHVDQAKQLMTEARELRKSYYEDRLDRARRPAYGLLKRMPSPWTPRR